MILQSKQCGRGTGALVSEGRPHLNLDAGSLSLSIPMIYAALESYVGLWLWHDFPAL
jgi:hypothetical protein